ncbi:MAG: hypothetical protein IJV01_06920 [Bacteroidales bacterium]|nr:hypothetical protein [Bacteroidales bacterium]
MGRKTGIILLFALVLLAAPGCRNKFKEVSVTSFDLASVVPTGLRSFDAVVALGVHNPAPEFTLRNIRGTVRRDTTALFLLTVEDVPVQGHTDKVYQVPVHGTLSDGVTLLQMAVLLRSFNPDEYKVDVSARASLAAGVGKNLEYNAIPLSKFMKNL